MGDKNLIIKEFSEGKVIYKLTQKGINKNILEQKDTQKWDGRWRIVIFDIPEKQRSIRYFLRSKLKEWEFINWQKSVWATKKNCTIPLRHLIKELNIENWVLVIESDNISSNIK